jgi:hypothetical protein
MRSVHYVGFRDDRFLNAYRIFGGPRIIHRIWDQRAAREIGEDDIVVFANGDEHQPISKFNGNDIDEQFLQPRRK